MRSNYSRRECLGILGSAAFLPQVASSVAQAFGQQSNDKETDLKKSMRGAFMILSTPFKASKEVDYEDLAAEVDWLDLCGVQGMVWPQNASEWDKLTRDEIMRGMEVITKAHKGKRCPLVLGVQQDDTKRMVELAGFAEKLAPDAMIAMPPKLAKSPDDYREYYSELAKVTKRPIFIQTVPDAKGVEMTLDIIVDLAGKYPHLGYVKEEHQPVLERLEKEVKLRPAPIQRVFGGNRGRTWPYEMRMGTDGTMNGSAMYGEVYPKLWNLYLQKDWDGIRELHSKLLLMLTVESEIPGSAYYLLKKRGLFKTSVSRQRDYVWSPSQIEEMDHNFKGLRPYLIQGRGSSA
jgi:4-hydroxy-tetrahydrodipicolinate synthase